MFIQCLYVSVETVAPRVQYFGSDDEDDQPLAKMIGHPNVSINLFEIK